MRCVVPTSYPNPPGPGARDKDQERHNPILTKMDTMVMTQLPKRNKEMVTEEYNEMQ